MTIRAGHISALAILAAGLCAPVAAMAQIERFEPYDPVRPIAADDEATGPEDDSNGDGAQRAVRRYESRPLAYRLRVSPRVTYSDNVELAPDDARTEDGLASVLFSGGALIDRVRFSGIVNGRIQTGAYFNPPSEDGASEDGEALYDRTVINHDVTAAGTLNLVENLLFFDLAASARQEAPDERTAYSATSLAGNARLSEAWSISASPYLFITRPSEDTIEARYRYTNVTIDDSETFFGTEDYLNDSTAHEVTAEYDSGRLLDRVGFAVKAYGNSTQETGSDILPEIDYAQASLSGDLRYALNRRLALSATLGHDFINIDGDSPFDDGDLSGTFWKAGIVATPGRKTEAALAVGERYGGTWVDIDASYRYSSRLQFQLAAQRQFLTTAQARAGRFGVLQSQTLSYAEELRQLQRLTAAEILDRVIAFNTGLDDLSRQQAGLSRTDAIYFDTVMQTPRNSLVLRAGYDRSDFGFQEIGTTSLGALFDRQLSRRLSLYARGDYQRAAVEYVGTLEDCVTALFQDPQFAFLGTSEIIALCTQPETLDTDADTISMLAGLEWLLFRDINGFAELSRSQRFSDNERDEYVENAATLGLSFDF